MDKLVRSIKFPMFFDPEKLKNDVRKIINKNWTNHYNTNDYTGKWTSIALMSQNGKSDSIFAQPKGDEKLVSTEIMDSCTYFQEILNSFLFEKTAARLLKLDVGAEIKPHTDNCLGYEDGCFRLHIPIITNSEVEFILDGRRLIMNEGECWYIDANFTHSVANRGTEDRIHLVVDGLRNDWTDDLFYKEASQNEFVRPATEASEKEKQLIIAELKRMNPPNLDAILKDLK
ncbi:aspartyl/asparaginyl beta-hydroxylase domain-containing protein [Flavobacterium pectinovorum]|uniref:aspartyl/asparaginyl beta-hydroxylase domain-containing protein n=1 Tax=Flavobacterium pectinovorum TaxID=29533 RepID=UPI001FAB49D2|nr:aspartyl/asparaginyl beta-hydroxylase domain-containing protein [Flavobacterium pectinovorum]MCI9844830.1 aspartyl/asparaginyl beta-hydroxylase domain-containing protein [Flavobacterium pectinovorum]